jgi:uroporphyrin-III C-methyltransferase
VSGLVFFVSAGPGDPELLTLKAAARLRGADVVLYDDLASGAILGHAREGAHLVSVGKRAGRPSAKQEYVSRLSTTRLLGRASSASSRAMPAYSGVSRRRSKL